MVAGLTALGAVWSSAQDPVRIPGVDEPPELTGEPKTVPPEPSKAWNEWLKIPNPRFVEEAGRNWDAQTTRLKIADFIRRHPDFSDAYAARAIIDLRILRSTDYAAILNDIHRALTLDSPDKVHEPAELYSLRASVEYRTGRFREALDDLEKAMRDDYDGADNIFQRRGTSDSPNDLWHEQELISLETRFPRDYRGPLFRGLYWKSFVLFERSRKGQALEQFQKATLLNPGSPLPPYYIASLSSVFLPASAQEYTDKGRNETQRGALEEYTRAIRADPRFWPAYFRRAGAYDGLQQLSLAIQDYDKVLELDPENITAYADRGLDKFKSGDYSGATWDLAKAIDLMKQQVRWAWQLGPTYYKLANAYGRISRYRDAIEDYSKALEQYIVSYGVGFSMRQFRGFYPEYGEVSDEVLRHKVRLQFWPQFTDSDVFRDKPLGGEAPPISDLHEVYEARGDAYLKTGDFRRAIADFKRVRDGLPEWARLLDRWRPLSTTADGTESYLDIWTVELVARDKVRLWVKLVKNDSTYSALAYESDCASKQIRSVSRVSYDSDGNVLENHNYPQPWQAVVPDTPGETLYAGACSLASSH
jgi:tetratricopeptide (TPR) repeat protein